MILVSILNWNRTNDTIAALRSVLSDPFSRRNVVAIVVDNNSFIPPIEAVRQVAQEFEWDCGEVDCLSLTALHPPMTGNVLLVRSATNRGFAGGHNLILERAPYWMASHVLVMNNDSVLEQGTLRRLLTVAQSKPRAGIVGCRLVHQGGSDPFVGGRRYWRWGVHLMRRARPTSAAVQAVNFVTGCVALLSVRMVEHLGPYDERYFVYVEDASMSYRANRHGWLQYVALDACAVHGFSRSLGRRSPGYYYYITRNTLLMIRYELRLSEQLTSFPAFFIQTLLRWLLFIGQCRHLHARAVIHGMVHFFRGQYGKGPAWLHPDPEVT